MLESLSILQIGPGPMIGIVLVLLPLIALLAIVYLLLDIRSELRKLTDGE